MAPPFSNAPPRKGLWAFLLLAFGPSWLIWEVFMARGWTPGQAEFPLAVLAGAFCPALACLVVRAWVTQEGFAGMGLRLRPRAWRWYALAWLWPLPAAGLVLALAAALGPVAPDWSLRAGPALGGALAGSKAWELVAGQFLAAPAAAVILFGEELGWRSWLQGRLAPTRPVLDAALTGLVWSAWHAPLILRGFDFPVRPLPGLAVFTVTAMLVSVFLGRIRQESRSIWPVCLAHGSLNAVGLGVTNLAFAPGHALWVSFVGVWGWIPLGLLAIWAARGLRPWPGPAAKGAGG